ncbi:YybH family protein [Adhaeretor mobilis]|uniref:SnoaL-like domain protein n=1 Tax=Adhaeretor mobilis TaxID=1930276 RepID=A0A517N154_9BACT|nr:SgcJ/EcaC family oxidoreductase [Adhaeretor mobilis]QDT00863.1 SnoaL-like domain protein [Adhaeretor mobilis]
MRIDVCRALCCIALSIASLGACEAQETKRPSIVQSPESTEAQDKEFAALRAGAQAFVEAFNKGDAQAVAALWTEDGEYVDDTGRSFVGREAIEKGYAEFFADNGKAKIQIMIGSLRLLSNDVAIEDGHTANEAAADGAAGISDYTVVHAKVDGKWHMASVRVELIESLVAQQNLADLDWLVGTWVAEDRGNKHKSVCRWVSDQSFVQRDFKVTRLDGTQTSGVQLIGWNPQGGYVQSWTFSADGGHAVGAWTPTEGGWSAQMQGMTGDGMSTSSTNILKRLDDKAYVWQSVDRTMGGVAYPDTDEVILKRLPVNQ